ncbi:FecR domain-containing protein [Larkinella knui]|uniref:FecR family protein n=1 Tax=Larkinella knui TaxID=2025310 RepID=A0A3P1CUW0_9BACT|nr:FecR family protein [Larkinella knui]RRB17039.1 FecR family protein [Larkinella knui]
MVRSRAEYLINKLISNTLTEKELDELLEGLGKDEMLEPYSSVLENYFNALIEEENPASKPELTINPDRDNQGAQAKRTTTRLPVQKFYTDYKGIAAFIALLFSLGTLYYFVSASKSYPLTALNRTTKAASTASPHTKEETVPRGKRKNLRLSDGSLVKLNSDTKLRFPKAFDHTVRTVYLQGEAFFNVERDESKPFVISAGDLKIKVLGTSFNVKNYNDENEVEITVRSGRVSVNLNSNSSTPIILIKDQKLIYNKASGEFKITDVNAAQESSWVNGSLQFNNTPMLSVERAIEKWYDVDIIIENKALYNTSFTGVHFNESLTSMLESITYAIDAQYEINGRTVVIRN